MSWSPHSLRILQYNVQQKADTMAALLRDPRVLGYDIIAIQEPWLNWHDKRLTHNPTSGRYKVFMSDKASRALVCFYISDKIDMRNCSVQARGAHMCTLHIEVDLGGQRSKVAIHNIYNPQSKKSPLRTAGKYEGIPKNSVLPELEQALQDHDSEHIVVGDFNLHHQMWYTKSSFPSNGRKRAEPAVLIAMMDQYGLDLCLQPGTVTRPAAAVRQRDTTIDLVWMTGALSDRLKSCQTIRALDYQSDHKPIATVVDIALPQREKAQRWNFKKTEGRLFTRHLQKHIPPTAPIHTADALDHTVDQLTQALQLAVQASTPVHKPCSRSIPGFTEECRDAIDACKLAQRQWKRYKDADSLQQYKDAKANRKKVIACANREAHRDRVSQVDNEKDLWNLVK